MPQRQQGAVVNVQASQPPAKQRHLRWRRANRTVNLAAALPLYDTHLERHLPTAATWKRAGVFRWCANVVVMHQESPVVFSLAEMARESGG